MSRRSIALLALAGFSALLIGERTPLLVWNASASAPIGLYAIRPLGHPAVGDLVAARPPAEVAEWLSARGYLPRGALLIKHVAALPGQKICRTDRALTVDGDAVAVAKDRDHLGRELPRWRGCVTLRPAEILLLNWDRPASLDGRYFGAFPSNAIVGHAAPLWTWEEDQ
jgi:conjugative transfer signal peptidase TraF